MNTRALCVVTVLLASTGFAQRPKVLIVSLGDSSASGEGNPDSPSPFTRWLASDTTDPRKASLVASDHECHRSRLSGPRLAADAFRNLHPELDVEFTSFACSGAKVGDVVGIAGAPRAHDGSTQGPLPFGPPNPINLPLQVQQVIDVHGSERIDALILNIGINDVGFATQVMRCMGIAGCQETWSPNYPNTAQAETDLANRYDALRTELRRLLPNVVNVYVNEYPDATTDDFDAWCMRPTRCLVPISLFPLVYPSDWQCTDPLVAGIEAAESRWASNTGLAPLNRVIQEKTAAAASDGWFHVDGVSEQFRRHGFCAQNRWVLTVTDSLVVQGAQQGTLHPNASGHAVYRDAILAKLEALKPPAVPTWNEYPLSYGLQNLMRVSWQPVARAAKYQLGVRAPAGTVVILPTQPPAGRLGDSPRKLPQHYQVQDTTSTSRDFTGLSGNVDFIVRACTESMCSAWSNVKRLTTLVPPAPVNVRPGAVTSAAVEVRFDPGPNPVIGTSYYNVVARRRGAEFWERHFANGAATSLSVPVTSGTWDFFVNACSTPDLCGPWSTGITVSTSPPAAPGKLKFASGVFSWVIGANNTETGLEVAWFGAFNTPYRVPVPRSYASVPLSGVANGPWVRACNDAGCSAWVSPVVNPFGPQPATLPLPPRPASAPTPPSSPPAWPWL
jgi:hypothetical protein